MPMTEPVGSNRQPSNSSSENDDGLDFIRCVGGRHTKIHDIWTFSDDGITPEVHHFARVDVVAFVEDCFAANFLTENGRRVPMLGRKFIDGSFEYVGVPDFLRTNGPPWNDNLLAPYADCGRGGRPSSRPSNLPPEGL